MLEDRGREGLDTAQAIDALQREPKVPIRAGDDVHGPAVWGDVQLYSIGGVGRIHACHPCAHRSLQHPKESIGPGGNAPREAKRARQRKLIDVERRGVYPADAAIPVLGEPQFVVRPEGNRMRSRIAKRWVAGHRDFHDRIRARPGVDVTELVFRKLREPHPARTIAGDVQ